MPWPTAPLTFDLLAPWQTTLLYLTLAIPVYCLGIRSLAGIGPVRKWLTLSLRLGLLLILVLALAGARWNQPATDLTVIIVRDSSRSTTLVHSPNPAGVQADITQYIFDQLPHKPPADRIGMISFDAQPWLEALPDTSLTTGPLIHHPIDGTNVAQSIQLALATMPPDTLHRIVLFWDGNATSGDLDPAALAAASQGVPIDVVPLHYQIDHECCIDHFIAPASCREKQSVTLDVILTSRNPGPVRASLSISDNDTPIQEQPCILQPGPTVLHIQTPPLSAGAHLFLAHLEPAIADPPTDTIAENNFARAATIARGQSRILYIAGSGADPSAPLSQALIHSGMSVDIRDPSAAPRSLLDLTQYSAVLLVNVPRGPGGMDDAQAAILTRYVHDMGGGLMVVGGPNAFGAGGWIDSDFEKSLPVDCQPPTPKMLPAGALVVVIDHSGSMGDTLGSSIHTKEEIADQAAIATLKTLLPDDQVGVIAFDTTPTWVVPLGPNRHPDLTASAIGQITPAGGTDIYPALAEASAALSHLSADQTPVRHIILLTDGESNAGDFDTLINRMASTGITLSTVGIGDEIDQELLAHFAKLGHGRFYRVANPDLLPQIFIREAMTLRNVLIREHPFTPRLLMPTSPLVHGLGDFPPLRGMIRTWPKPAAAVEVPLVSDNGDPVLAAWPYGLGHVAVFTSDAEPRWAADWVASDHFQKIWTQFLQSIWRADAGDQIDATLYPGADGQGKLIVESDLSPAESAEISYPANSFPPISVRLIQCGVDTYEADFPLPPGGICLAAVSTAAGGWTAAAYVADPSAEMRNLESNESALAQLAATTHGRLIQPFDRSANFFDRRDLPPRYTSLPLMHTLILLGMITLLLDVAVRRIAWNRRTLTHVATAIRSHTVPPTLRQSNTQTTDLFQRLMAAKRRAGRKD